MSRKATNEYIGARRRAHADAKPEKRNESINLQRVSVLFDDLGQSKFN